MKSDFFTFDSIGGNYTALKNDIRLGTPTAVFGVSDAHKYLTACMAEGKVLYVTADAVTANKAFTSISALSGKKCALLPAKDEVILYKDALSKDALFRRITALYEISRGADIIICDAESAIQLVPSHIGSIHIKKDGEYDYASLPSRLIRMGYTREYSVESKGTFAVRGDILDIFPVNTENPVRIDFFGDTAERIRPYEQSGERLDDIDEIIIASATDVEFTREDVTAVKEEVSRCLKTCRNGECFKRAKTIAEDLFEKLDGGLPFSGASFVAPLLKGSCTLFDIIPEVTVILDECKLISDRAKAVYKEHAARVADLKNGGEAFDFSLGQLMTPERFYDNLTNRVCIALQTFTVSTQFFRPLRTYNFTSTPAPSYLNAMPQLVTDVKNWLSNGYRILIFTGGIQRTERLSEIFADEYFPVYPVPDRLKALHGISLVSAEMPHGLIIHESKLVILGSSDLYTKVTTKRIRKKRGDMFTAPEIGDYAVHEKHGIGRITGTKKIETTDGIKEYVALEYKGGDVLYVPVEQMDVLSKYVGETNPALSRIGGADFDRVKERVKRSIRELAFDLKQLYADRKEKKGFRFPENTAMMQEFEDAFSYDETPDQLMSVEEIKADMCSDKVMDRLLCGDVGYGKTEVALRAVYLCVLGGKQACLMCPGTVLSEQHFNTALERFADFGVRVEKLNRFKTPAQQAATLKRLANGDIDFIIGTHRLLSEDVKFGTSRARRGTALRRRTQGKDKERQKRRRLSYYDGDAHTQDAPYVARGDKGHQYD